MKRPYYSERNLAVGLTLNTQKAVQALQPLALQARTRQKNIPFAVSALVVYCETVRLFGLSTTVPPVDPCLT